MSDARWVVTTYKFEDRYLVYKRGDTTLGSVGRRQCAGGFDDLVAAIREQPLLRRVLGEYVQGNQIIDGHWYSPDETGAPHYKNDPATPEELALIDSLKTEVGL